jgi:flagellar basal body-associated protein FliL
LNEKGKESSSDGGLELDRFDVVLPHQSGTIDRESSPSEGEFTLERDDSPKGGAGALDREGPPKHRLWAIFSAVIIGLLVIAVGWAVFHRGNFVHFRMNEGPRVSTENYLRVGPVRATLANKDTVQVSIQIECKSNAIKKRLTGKDSLIRDQIIEVLTDPATKELLQAHAYDAIKSKLRARIKTVVGDDIGKVYLADLLEY